jgi:hypothetical protein
MKNDLFTKRYATGCVLLLLIAMISLVSCSSGSVNIDKFEICINGDHPIPIDRAYKFPGDLLFARSDGSEILALSGETHEFTSVLHMPIDKFYDVSPLSWDGKTLVLSYREPDDVETLSIILLSNLGSFDLKKVALPNLWKNRDNMVSWIPSDWVNDRYLQGRLYEEGSAGDELWETLLLDPYELRWTTMSNINSTVNQAQGSGFSISPDLTRVLHVDDEYHLILYDLIQNEILWKHDDYDGVVPRFRSPILGDATWSSDGEILALPITSENRTPALLLLSKDGRIIHSFNFDNYQYGYSWSKNNQFLSFYEDRCISNDCMDSAPIIRAMDIKGGSLKDLCLLPDVTVPIGGIANNRIAWSPDQQFLAYTYWSGSTSQDGIILQKVKDPQIRMIEIDNDTMILLGWSEYHWTSVNSQP